MRSSYSSLLPTRRRGGMADALDSKSSDRKIVWVQPPPPALPFFSSELAFFRGKSQPRKCPLECRNGCAGPEAPWRGRYRATETKDSHTKIPFSGEARTSDVIRRACRFN